MNAAYSYGGPALVVKTFKRAHRPAHQPLRSRSTSPASGTSSTSSAASTCPIDHTYYVPASADYKSINLEPGYQLVRGKQALNFVRFRHDQHGDFTRMQRQQLFLKEMQRQSGRWSSDWTKVAQAASRRSPARPSPTSSSLKKIAAAGRARLPGRHLQGVPGAPRGRDADDRRRLLRDRHARARSPRRCAEFTNPTQAPVKTKGAKIGKKMYAVQRLQRQRHRRAGDDRGDAAERRRATRPRRSPTPTSTRTRSRRSTRPRAWRPRPGSSPRCCGPSDVRIVDRAPGHQRRHQRVRRLVVRRHHRDPARRSSRQQQTLEKDQKLRLGGLAGDSTQRRRSGSRRRRRGPPGFTYDQFRNYSIKTTEGKRSAASVAVVQTPQYGYWSIQAMRWLDPPAIENPNAHADDRRAASTCSSTRATTCTWSPGRSAARCTGCSTPWTTSSRTTS